MNAFSMSTSARGLDSESVEPSLSLHAPFFDYRALKVATSAIAFFSGGNWSTKDSQSVCRFRPLLSKPLRMLMKSLSFLRRSWCKYPK